MQALCVGYGVVRIDALHFLAGCRTRQLNQILSVSYLSMFSIVLFTRAHFYVLLVFVGMFSVLWLFWLNYQYLLSDWLERLL